MRSNRKYYLEVFSKANFDAKTAEATKKLITAHISEDGKEVIKPAELVCELSKLILQSAVANKDKVSAILQPLSIFRRDVVGHFKTDQKALVETRRKLEELKGALPADFKDYIPFHITNFIQQELKNVKVDKVDEKAVPSLPSQANAANATAAAGAAAVAVGTAAAVSPTRSGFSSPLPTRRQFMNGIVSHGSSENRAEQKKSQAITERTAEDWFKEAEKHWNIGEKFEYVDNCFNQCTILSWKTKEFAQWKVIRGRGLHYINWARSLLDQENPDFDAAILYFEKAKTCFECILGAPEGPMEQVEDSIAENHNLACEMIKNTQAGKKLAATQAKSDAAEAPRITFL